MTLRKKFNKSLNSHSIDHIEVHNLSPQPSRTEQHKNLAHIFQSPKSVSTKIFQESPIAKDVLITSVPRRLRPKSRTILPRLGGKISKKEGVFIPCTRHPQEGLKFINVLEGKYEGLCDKCMVSSENMGKNMRLELLKDIYEKKKTELAKTQRELEDLETKITKLHKEIMKNNITMQPMLRQLDDMENRIVKEVESCFKRIKAKFIKFNPFKDIRETLHEKISTNLEVLGRLEEGTSEVFHTLQDLVGDKLINDNKSFIMELENKIYMNSVSNPLQEKDFNLLAYEYDKFLEKVQSSCRQFSQIIKARGRWTKKS